MAEVLPDHEGQSCSEAHPGYPHRVPSIPVSREHPEPPPPPGCARCEELRVEVERLKLELIEERNPGIDMDEVRRIPWPMTFACAGIASTPMTTR